MTADRPQVADVGVGRAVRRIGAQFRKALLRFRLGHKWEMTESGFARRVYPDYRTYIVHQRTKFDAARSDFVRRHDERFYTALSERLSGLPYALAGRSVLCIAARQGTEVRAFIDRGAFGIGIDLNPGRDNPYVVAGDFHALQYADGSVQVVYTNSLDHAYELDRVISEIHRVLTPDGLLIVELNTEQGEGSAVGFYESSAWSGVDDMLRHLTQWQFTLERRTSFAVPWGGEQLVLKRGSDAPDRAAGPAQHEGGDGGARPV